MIEEKPVLIRKKEQEEINRNLRLWEAVVKLALLVQADKLRLMEEKK